MEINVGKIKEFTLKVPEGKPGGSDPPALSFRLEPSLEATLELLEALGRGDKFEVVLRQYQAGLGKPPELFVGLPNGRLPQKGRKGPASPKVPELLDR